MVFVRLRRPQLRARVCGYDLARVFRGDAHQESVLVNAIYGRALHALARLARSAGDEAVAATAEERAARVVEALVAKSWDPATGLFHDLCGNGEARTQVRTVSALTPLALPGLPDEHVERLVANLTDPRRFWPAYPVPSVALDEPTFSRDSRLWGLRLIWRGPLSLNTNWLLAHGLAERGYDDLARALGDRSRELAERHGFNEFYDPLDGTPVGEPAFGWATLATDMP
jgi:glycogen debranching enzyme